ncbi:flavodoxin family protein [Alkaliphilus hydrothermalis]|uniref:Multimeric flavodoxin WrbA n=1 Tax=Alkaliphilus hydrothermalis TaxID=1482730 RepID=A0ABS2NNM3_9FIRM|nr:flavodoxin family protein [Alkaliphilus hydrothermalis]MBM7614550.1 multimeric flavodoxin WrbA [Alkaliphilus hydrothermalis]
MNKKVIAINSSKRKRNTHQLLEQLKNQLKEKHIEVEILNLFDYEIQECIGCEVCLRKGNCSLKDDHSLLMKKLTEYDGLVLSTPVYMGNVSGKLKVFVDRTCKWFHRPELVGIPVLSVATTSASGLGDTFKTLESVAIQWGAFPTDRIARQVKDLHISLEEKEYRQFLKHLNQPKSKYKPSMKQVIHFQVQKVLAEKVLPIDKDYWQQQGWTDKGYFYDSKAALTTKAFGNLFYRFLSSRVKKVGE